MSGITSSVKALALFILIVGGAAICFLTFGVALSFLFALFSPPPVRDQILGYSSMAGPVPLLAGAVLLFFKRTQRFGAKLTLAGSAILTAYLVICYVRLNPSAGVPVRLFLFVLLPVVVLVVDVAAYRIYKLTNPSGPVPAKATAGETR